MGIYSAVSDLYTKYNYELADPRTNDFLLISSPFKLIFLLGMYLWFCLKAGPHLMKNREPFQLKKILIVYNLFQVLISCYFFSVSAPIWFSKLNWLCIPIDYSYSEEAILITKWCHIYFISKIIELLDTVFFVLRKKYSQVTTLHLYHHSCMVLLVWIGTKYFAGGQGTIMAVVNSVVHIVMYFYYFIACLGPKYQKYLTWKKQLTMLQLVQFAFLFVYHVLALFQECDYPKSIIVVGIIQAAVFMYMFSMFYIEVYMKPKHIKTHNAE